MSRAYAGSHLLAAVIVVLAGVLAVVSAALVRAATVGFQIGGSTPTRGT